MLKQCLAVILSVSALCGFAKELLPEHSLGWKTYLPGGAEGRVAGRENGVELVKTNDAGVLFYFTGNNVPVEPGKRYLFGAEFSGEETKGDPFFQLTVPGTKNKYEWKTLNPDVRKNRAETVVTVQPGDTRVRVHAGLKKSGRTVVRRIYCRELAPSTAGLLADDGLNWKSFAVEGGKGTFARNPENDSVTLEKTGDAGIVFFFNGKDVVLPPGKHYKIECELASADPAVRPSLMVNVSGSKHKYKWEELNSVFRNRKARLIVKLQPEDGRLRIHLVLRGSGKAVLKRITVTEAAKEDLEEKKLSAFSFDAEVLKDSWNSFQGRVGKEERSFRLEAANNGGWESGRLALDTAKIAEIRAVFSAKYGGGCLRLDFVSEWNGKRFSGFQMMETEIDGKFRTLRFPVQSHPMWRGTVNRLRLTWVSPGESEIALAALYSLAEQNLLADPKAFRAGARVEIPEMTPRGIYEFRSKEKLPSGKIEFLDRNYQPIRQQKIAGGANSFRVEMPVMAMTTAVTFDRTPDSDLNLRLVRRPPIGMTDYWNGGKWIWCQLESGPEYATVRFRRDISIRPGLVRAQLVCTADDNLRVLVNGRTFRKKGGWATSEMFDLTESVKPGGNTLEAVVFNAKGAGGFLGELHLSYADGSKEMIPTDDKWSFQYKEKNGPAYVIGPPPVAPWSDQMDYRFLGEQGVVEVLDRGTEFFKARVLSSPGVDRDTLSFRIRLADGREKQLPAVVSPSTGAWKKGEVVTVRYRLPAEKEAAAVFLDDEFFRVRDNAAVGMTRRREKEAPPLSTAKIVHAGGRACIEFNGRKLPPAYFYFKNDIVQHIDRNTVFLREAAETNPPFLRGRYFLSDGWKAPGRYDFSVLDRFMEMCELYMPGTPVVINLVCEMPSWWVKANPGEAVTYAGGLRPHPQDRQSLASRKWLEDVKVPMKALIDHIKQQPYAGRILGLAPSECWNSEWFWNYISAEGKFAVAGYGPAGQEAFRDFLKKRYGTDAALADAWKTPGLTFRSVTVPLPAEFEKGSVGALLDAGKDRRLIDFFDFRSDVLADAIEALCKVVKEETDGKWLTGVFYGYLIPFSFFEHGQRLQTIGHMAIERIARSPYVDFITGPSYYSWRAPGMADSAMQPAEAFSSHGKLVIVEQDLRTYTEPADIERTRGLNTTPESTVGNMHRAFGMMAARGMGQHWFDLYARWYREKLLRDVIREQFDLYRALPSPAGTTPVEVTVVSDARSTSYTKYNAHDAVHKGLIAGLLLRFNECAVPFRHVMLDDILTPGLIAPAKFYIMTNTLVLSREERIRLNRRFEREKATVLWLYAPGVFFPDAGPSAENMEDLLGIRVGMTTAPERPELFFPNGGRVRNVNRTAPWFYPVDGFTEILARDAKGKPGAVAWSRGPVRHLFSMVPNLSPEILTPLLAGAGVHRYSDSFDPVHIGNDLLFLYAKSSGPKTLHLPPGTRAKAILGPFKGIVKSGEPFPARAGQCYGFLIEKQ